MASEASSAASPKFYPFSTNRTLAYREMVRDTIPDLVFGLEFREDIKPAGLLNGLFALRPR